MRKSFFVIALVAAGCISEAQLRGSDLLANYATALEKIQSISTTYTITPVTGLPKEFKVDLSRPNRAKLESTDLLVLADGQDIYTYSKKQNAFYRRPQTEDGLQGLFTGISVQFLAPFFKKDAFTNVVAPHSLGEIDRKGSKLNGVEFAADESRALRWTMFFTPEDSMIRQARYVSKDDFGESTSVLHISSWTIDQTPPEAFTWSTPAGAREISGGTIQDGKWFTDYEEARMGAMLSQRILLLVVGSKSTGAASQVEALVQDPQIRAVASKFVFCRVNIEDNRALASQLKAGPLPTIRFFRWDGAYMVGSSGPTNAKTFFPLVAQALARAK